MKIGAQYLGNGRCEFIVWAPLLNSVDLKIVSPEKLSFPIIKDEKGYRRILTEGVFPGALYFYCLDGQRDRPDPASHSQPQGVHGPSEVLDHSTFKWEDSGWKGIPLSKMIMYEIHVGTFTPEGTFDAVILRLDELSVLGINTIELMPVAQFPGERNWGYDGTYPFAVQNSYGGPEGLKILINECHKKGMAVILDVVYNHFGPEGNYLWDYGPYFTDRYKTPWGQAINYDGLYSNEVRNFFIENALHWFKNYHFDALRLDAIHGIFDFSARPFLQELAEKVEELSINEGKKYYLIAESDLNDSRIVRPRNMGGYGIDAQWCDDFHHSVHTLLTGENRGYYIDFAETEHLIKSLREGFVYSGQYSEYRKKNHGNFSKDRPAEQFIVFSQNHDQVGNRIFGERLSNLVSFESLKLAAGAVLLSPYIPLLFMGEEYGDDAPFLYFVSHSDPDLIEAVRKGRKEEFKSFSWNEEPPDPQAVETFLKSKINWEKRKEGEHKVLLDFYKSLIKLRRDIPALSYLDKECIEVFELENKKTFSIQRWKDGSEVYLLFNFDNNNIKFTPSLTKGSWEKIFDSSEKIWNGPGTFLQKIISQGDELTVRGLNFVLYIKSGEM
ncbi:MAG: malto-oligosyltrehalose trehalohydrolase [Thermodesulfovibrio sp. RBG_19FT_COMBO_42_12]|nr:MAG: malto-oligosyltrehalose trehalohydrolase [Thermodesulfovibrio sp. RBG_19FT_COMBO_42_12]